MAHVGWRANRGLTPTTIGNPRSIQRMAIYDATRYVKKRAHR